MRSVIQRLLGVFRSRAVENDLHDEIRSHIEMRAELLAQHGWSTADARDEARRMFGNRTLVAEEARSHELLPRLESVMQDIHYGTRILRRNPAFTTIALLVLGLGIGLNAAMFSVFDHVLLAPLPFPNASQLSVISSRAQSLGGADRLSSGPDFRDYRDQNRVFAHVAALIPRFSMPWTGDGEPRIVTCAAATTDFFTVMGIHPAMGRLLVPDEFHDLANETAVVSWTFWKTQLGGDANVIGRTIILEDSPTKIVGVLPPMPDIYSDVDVWLKLTTEPSWPYMNWRANKFLDVVGRLKPGVSPRVAEEELTAILRRGNGEPADVQVHLTGLQTFVVGPVSRQLTIIMAAVALVLLVTLLNTAAILLARSIARVPELAMRLGLGASRARIRRQLFVEGTLLSVAGGALGVLIAFAAIATLQRFPMPAVPRLAGVTLSRGALGVSLAVVVASSLVFAVLLMTLLRFDLASAFRGGRTQTGRAQRPFAALIVAEISCAVVLTVCAGLLVLSSVRVHDVKLGYQPDRVALAYLRTNYNDPDGYAFWSAVLRTTRAIPGATSSAISDCLPGVKANAARLTFEGRPTAAAEAPSTEACWISADYFRTIGASLVHGRFFTDRDDANASPVALINVEAARRLFGGVDPIGKRIGVAYVSLGSRTKDGVPRMREIVGVVADLRQRAVDLPPSPAVYLPYSQDETYHVLNSMEVFVRSTGDATRLGPEVRSSIQALYPNQPVERIRVMRQEIARSLARRTFAVALMTSFALLALVLCGLGLYGVVSYAIQQRTREIAIRVALGAQRGDVLGGVLKGGGLLVAIGVIIGTAVSLVVAGGLSQLLFETAIADPVVYGATILILGSTGMAACLLPAMRASRVDPRSALNGS